MLTSNDAQLSSPTDRAVKIAVAVLLPTVFGFFVVRHLWLTPLVTSPPQGASVAVAGDSQSPNLDTPLTGDATNHNSTVAMGAHPVAIRIFPATVHVIAESHAPTELTMVGRAIVDPDAFAPTALQPRIEQSLRRELATAATELDLYGTALRPDNRFGRMKKEVTDNRSNHMSFQKELFESIRLKTSKVRRSRSPRERQTLRQELEEPRSQRHAANNFTVPHFQPLKDWLDGRDDLQGLPLVMGSECRLDAAESVHLQKVSTLFRNFRRLPSHLGIRIFEGHSKDGNSTSPNKRSKWSKHDIPGLMQIVTAEKVAMRLDLVDILSELSCHASSIALAKLATFDVSAEVRKNAIEALDGRPKEEFRGELLVGLRYVWPPAANNAAEALVALDDRGAFVQLAALARQSDPRAPYQKDNNQWAVHELVRVNHMRNCLLCHAPIVTTIACVGGAVPSPYDPPRVEYYQKSDFSVRADVTYLRQDFSVVHPVENHGQWPAEQRYDYFVRERKLGDKQAGELTRQFSSATYPQRVAVIYAMSKLRGRPFDGESVIAYKSPLLSAD